MTSQSILNTYLKLLIKTKDTVQQEQESGGKYRVSQILLGTAVLKVFFTGE